MRTFYVSLSKDLLHVYLKFEAPSQMAVRQYLESEYYYNGIWKLPWCSIYEDLPAGEEGQIVIDRTRHPIRQEAIIA